MVKSSVDDLFTATLNEAVCSLVRSILVILLLTQNRQQLLKSTSLIETAFGILVLEHPFRKSRFCIGLKAVP